VREQPKLFSLPPRRSGILTKACREQESHKGSGRMPANIRPPLTTTFFSSISKHTNIGTRCSGGMKVRRPAGLPLHLALLPPHLALPLRLARRSTRRLLRGKSRRKFTKTTPQMILCYGHKTKSEEWYWWDVLMERTTERVNVEFLGVSLLYQTGPPR
jgi:hypothetical protein